MSDTIKTVRPWFPRSPTGPAGRVHHDERGNAVWVRTRATDVDASPEANLSLVDVHASVARSAKRQATASYYESAAPDSTDARRRPRDLRAYSRWIEAQKLARGNRED